MRLRRICMCLRHIFLGLHFLFFMTGTKQMWIENYGQKPATTSPVARMIPTITHFSLHFCVVVVPDNFSPCTHHRAPVVHLTRGCVRCSVVGDWHAMPNIFRNWMPESWPPPNSSTSSALGILHPLSKHQWASLESLASTLSITASTLSVLFYSFSSLLPKAHKSSFGCVSRIYRLCLLPDAHLHLLSIRSCRCAPSACYHSKRNISKEDNRTISMCKFGFAGSG
jgi:hypothetical protein